MNPWWALVGLGVFALLVFVVSFLGYREQVRWHEDFDRRNPGVAEKLGVKSRVSNPAMTPRYSDEPPKMDFPWVSSKGRKS